MLSTIKHKNKQSKQIFNHFCSLMSNIFFFFVNDNDQYDLDLFDDD